MDALVAWALNYALAGPVATALGAVPSGSTHGWAAHGALRLAAVFLLVVWLKLVRGVDVTDLKALFPATRRLIGVGAVVGLAFFAVEYLTVVAIQLIDRQPNLVDGTWNPWVATRSLTEPTIVFLLVFAVVGPLVEEFVHRGVAYPALRSRLPKIMAAVLSSTVFALGHDWTAFDLVGAFALGLIAIWLVERYKSLTPAIAAHMASNLSVVVVGWSLYHLFGVPGTFVG